MSWAGGPRSKSGNRLERPASGMDFLKEDDGEKLANKKGVASGHDVNAHGDDAIPVATNGAVMNGAVTNGTIPKDDVTDGASTNGLANGSTINESENSDANNHRAT